MHWAVVKRILRYLRDTSAMGLCFTRSGSTFLSSHSDADWAGNVNDCRSTDSFAIFLDGNIVFWSSRSSTESEYKALADATAELIWIQVLLSELGIRQTRPPSL
jgi:hypothetical protein